MGTARVPKAEMLVVAAFSRHAEALQWARSRLEDRFGPIALASRPFVFHQTGYYASSMGLDLQKLFFTFQKLVAPDELASIKHQTNALEQALAEEKRFAELRPLNLDPGLLGLGKFVLTTTKDQAHRIYLRDGIYAEVTLRFHDAQFDPWPWTYADYRQPEVLQFFKEARDDYRRRLQETPGS